MTGADKSGSSADLENSSCKTERGSHAGRGRNLNQNLLADTTKELKIRADDIAVVSSAARKAMASSESNESQTTPVEATSQRSQVAAAPRSRPPRPPRPVHFLAEGRCYGFMLDTKAAGPTCHGVSTVHYRMKYHRRFNVPHSILTGDGVASLKTPFPYRGVCVKTLEIPARVQAPSKLPGKKPADLLIRTIDVQITPDPSKSLPAPRKRSRQPIEEPPTLAVALANTARYVWSHPIRSAREVRCYMGERFTFFKQEWGRRHSALQFTQRRETAWRSVKQKWRCWRRTGRNPFQD